MFTSKKWLKQRFQSTAEGILTKILLWTTASVIQNAEFTPMGYIKERNSLTSFYSMMP